MAYYLSINEKKEVVSENTTDSRKERRQVLGVRVVLNKVVISNIPIKMAEKAYRIF